MYSVSVALLLSLALFSGVNGYYDEALINAVNNNPASTWIAGRNPVIDNLSLDQIQRMLGTQVRAPSNVPYRDIE